MILQPIVQLRARRSTRFRHPRVVLVEHALPVFAPSADGPAAQFGAARERFLKDEPRMLDALLMRGRLDRADGMGRWPTTSIMATRSVAGGV